MLLSRSERKTVYTFSNSLKKVQIVGMEAQVAKEVVACTDCPRVSIVACDFYQLLSCSIATERNHRWLGVCHLIGVVFGSIVRNDRRHEFNELKSAGGFV